MRLNYRHSFNKKAFALFLAAAMAFEGSYAVPAYAQEAGTEMKESISSEAQAKESSSITQDAAEWEESTLDGKQTEGVGTVDGAAGEAEEKPGGEAVEEETGLHGETAKKEGTGKEGLETEDVEEGTVEPGKEETEDYRTNVPEEKEDAEKEDVEKEDIEKEDGIGQDDSEKEGIGEDKEDIFNGIEALDEASALKAANASSGKCGKNLTWTLDGKGVLMISGQGAMDSYYYSEYNPEGKKAPWEKNAVKKVIIEKGVTGTGTGAFSECINLTDVEIALGLEYINGSSFKGCSKLESIAIPGSVKDIYSDAFAKCSNLKKVKIANGVKNIYSYAFSECSKLESITIPNSISAIKDSVFSGCSGLRKVVIPNSVTTIEQDAFSGCSSLESITIPGKIIRERAFSGCSSLKKITIPSSVSIIEDSVFMDCSSLKSVVIQSKSVSIGKYVFNMCSNLENVEIQGSITNLGKYAFSGCDNLKNVETTGTGGIVNIGAGTFYRCKSLESIKISKGLKYIGDNAFYECTNLTKVVLPKSVTNIGFEAFCGCTKLSEIVLPDALVNIGIRAFGACGGLKNINIPAGVEYIGERAFYNCTALSNIVLPKKNNLSTLGGWAFDGTGWITNQKNDFVMLGNILIKYNGKASSVAIPEKVTVIADSAFVGTYCSSIEKITVSGKNNILNVGQDVFWQTKWFKDQKDDFVVLENILIDYNGNASTVKIPEQITVIADGCFQRNKNIKSIVLHDKITTIGASCFSGSGITSIMIPGSVTNVAYCTFQGCSALENVVLGDGVKNIGLSAFANSKNMKEITIPKSVDKIEGYSIGYYYAARNGYSKLYSEYWGEEDARNKLPTVLCFENSVAHRYAVTHEKLYQFLDKTVKSMSKCKISISASSFPYTGDPITPAVTIKDGSKKLKEGTDYQIKYEDNEWVGTATITITGIGYYSGTVTKKFAITSPAPAFTYKKSYSKTYGDKAFSLNIKQTGGSEKLSYSSSNKKVAAVSSSGKVTVKGTGIAVITVKSAVSKTVLKTTVKVSPVRQKISSVKALKGKKLTAAWKKDATASGYRIQYSTDKKFKKGVKDVWVRKNKTKTTTITKLKAGKRYYIRICSYKDIKENGKAKKLYGKWSNVVLSQKIKK